jgi:hypothetical protein
MDHGHTEARLYPVPMVWMEVSLVRERLNQEIASNASLTQLVIGSILSKKAGAKLKERLRDLVGD